MLFFVSTERVYLPLACFPHSCQYIASSLKLHNQQTPRRYIQTRSTAFNRPATTSLKNQTQADTSSLRDIRWTTREYEALIMPYRGKPSKNCADCRRRKIRVCIFLICRLFPTNFPTVRPQSTWLYTMQQCGLRMLGLPQSTGPHVSG